MIPLHDRPSSGFRRRASSARVLILHGGGATSQATAEVAHLCVAQIMSIMFWARPHRMCKNWTLWLYIQTRLAIPVGCLGAPALSSTDRPDLPVTALVRLGGSKT